MGHVVNVLQMSGAELDEHLLQTARDNPLLVVRQRRQAASRSAIAHDLLDRGFAETPNSLYDHVLRELAGLIAHGGPMERLILGLVEELEPSGWLGRPVPEIADSLGLRCDLVETGLALVQRRVSPAGLFAKDLKDCLRLQLEDQDLLTDNARVIVRHLDLLEKGGVEGLAQATGLDVGTVNAHLARLRRLDPKPGVRFSTDLTLMREADVRIEPRHDGWEPVFKPGFEAEVAMLPGAPGDSSSEMRKALAEARALKQALDLRQSALKQIVRFMVAFQEAFFREGPEALKPLTQAMIAEKTSFHLSTVSRVLNGLLIEGPNGVFEARALCARRSARTAQGSPSKPWVMARLRAVLLAEGANCPLSDQRLCDCLGAEGIVVSRRVVAKYRHELGFAPAAQRCLRA